MTCCEDKSKREVVEEKDGKRVERCSVCGRLHHRLTFTPFSLTKPQEKRSEDADRIF